MWYGTYHTLKLLLVWSLGTAHIGLWLEIRTYFYLPLCCVSFQRQSTRYPSTQTTPYQTYHLFNFCPLLFWSGAPNPELFPLRLLVWGRRPRIILVERSRWGFYEVVVFYGFRWNSLGKYGVFKLVDVALETRFLRVVGVPALISGSAPAGTGPSLLIWLVFFPHGDVLDINSFFIIMLILLPSCSY